MVHVGDLFFRSCQGSAYGVRKFGDSYQAAVGSTATRGLLKIGGPWLVECRGINEEIRACPCWGFYRAYSGR